MKITSQRASEVNSLYFRNGTRSELIYLNEDNFEWNSFGLDVNKSTLHLQQMDSLQNCVNLFPQELEVTGLFC